MSKDTYIPRNEVLAIHEAFNKVRKQAEEELMKLPGVVAVGVGLKEIQGEINRIPCFKVTVETKKPTTALKPEHLVPGEIYGFPTDVNEMMVSFSGANPSKYRPLMGGSQIEPSAASGAGTLGCFAKRNADNKIVLLSNWHVMVGRQDQLDNDRVGQPSHNGCCSCCATNEIATVTDGRFLTDEIDAAIALLNGQESDAIPEERYLNEILEIGAIAGGVAPQPVPGSGSPLAMETVYKYGRTTGLTKGQIINDNTSAATIYKEYKNLSVTRNFIVVIQPLPPFTDFFLEGDSGSVSVNELNQVVSLNYAFTTLHFTFSHSIVRVATTLGITVLDSSFHGSVAGKEGVLLGSFAAAPERQSLAGALAEMEAVLSGAPQGLRLLDLFKTHREELLDLVRHKREVLAAWNRYQGPAYLAHIAKHFRTQDKPVPGQIKGITLQSLILKMAAVLQRNASPPLAGAVADNYLLIMHMAAAGRTRQEWEAYLQQTDRTSNA